MAIAADATSRSLPQGIHTEYHQWDLFPYWHLFSIPVIELPRD